MSPRTSPMEKWGIFRYIRRGLNKGPVEVPKVALIGPFFKLFMKLKGAKFESKEPFLAGVKLYKSQ
jgi:hypothetical protein